MLDSGKVAFYNVGVGGFGHRHHKGRSRSHERRPSGGARLRVKSRDIDETERRGSGKTGRDWTHGAGGYIGAFNRLGASSSTIGEQRSAHPTGSGGWWLGGVFV
ncbi:unnamed protein product [Calypogeia fissa]